MKKNKVILILVAIFMIFINYNVQAENLGYYLSNAELNYNYDSAPSEIKVKRGDYIYVTAIINDVQGSGLTLKDGRVTIRWDSSYLELVPYSDNKLYSLEKSSFQDLLVSENSRTSNRISFDYSSGSVINQGINRLMEFKFRVLDNSKSGLTRIYEMDGETNINCLNNEETVVCGTSYNSELKYNIDKSTIDTLSSIKIDGKEIDNYNENVLEYNVNYESTKESINIEAIKNDEKASISGDIGKRTLNYGLNTFNIEVISESGSKKNYIINATRKDTRSTDNTLKNIKLSDGIIQFKPDLTDYSIDVKNEVDEITVIAVLNDSKAKFKEDFSKKVIELVEGINKISITVIAENGDERTYTINITRKLSGNNTLKELTINNEKIKLNKNEFLYYYTVSNTTENVSINAIATDNNANVEIGKLSTLQVGENEVEITVTAPNGDVVKYTIVITREQQLSNNAKLSDLEVVGYKLNFNKDTTYYDLKIKDEDSLELIYETEDEKAVVSVEGNRNLVDGSIIKINVKAEDNTMGRYFINIEKGEKSNGILWIVIIILIILLALIIIIVANKKRKSQKKKSNVKMENNNKKEIVENTTSEEEDSNTSVDVEEKSVDGNVSDDNKPKVDLEKTIFAADLNPVVEEKKTKKKIDVE